MLGYDFGFRSRETVQRCVRRLQIWKKVCDTGPLVGIRHQKWSGWIVPQTSRFVLPSPQTYSRRILERVGATRAILETFKNENVQIARLCRVVPPVLCFVPRPFSCIRMWTSDSQPPSPPSWNVLWAKTGANRLDWIYAELCRWVYMSCSAGLDEIK